MGKVGNKGTRSGEGCQTGSTEGPASSLLRKRTVNTRTETGEKKWDVCPRVNGFVVKDKKVLN